MALIEDYTIGKTLKERAIRHFGNQQRVYERMLNQVWNNSEYTPQQVFDSLGTDGEAYINYVTSVRQFILGVKPGATITSPTAYGTVTVNPDGSVTVD